MKTGTLCKKSSRASECEKEKTKTPADGAQKTRKFWSLLKAGVKMKREKRGKITEVFGELQKR